MPEEQTRGQRIVAEVKALIADNNAKLATCPLPHRFTIPIDRITKQEIPERKLFCKWKCELCGAIQDFEHKYWYELGLKHAKPKFNKFRADGWPFCPQCGEDELYSLNNPATIESICGCYRCSFKP